MPINYVLLIISGNHMGVDLVWMLISIILDLEKLHGDMLQVKEITIIE
jgi:hypothetical protein